jgi:DNA-binding MarR family transcriptional regulator
VQRTIGAHDRRARLLHLPAKGRRLPSASRPVVQAVQADILAPLSPAERTTFLALARKALGLG